VIIIVACFSFHVSDISLHCIHYYLHLTLSFICK
jgi:hypothetical protein